MKNLQILGKVVTISLFKNYYFCRTIKFHQFVQFYFVRVISFLRFIL